MAGRTCMLANWADCLNFVESKLVESCFQFLLSASCFGRHSFKSNKLPNDVWLCSLICEPDKLVRHKWHTQSTHSVLHAVYYTNMQGHAVDRGARSQLIHTAAERAHTSLSLFLYLQWKIYCLKLRHSKWVHSGSDADSEAHRDCLKHEFGSF